MPFDTVAKTPRKGSKGSLKEVVGKTVQQGQEAWRIVRDGRPVTIRTRRASVRAMDEAVVTYDLILRNLAKR